MRAQRPRSRRPSGPPLLVSEKLHGVRRWDVFVSADGELSLSGFDRMWRNGGEATEAQCVRMSAYRSIPAHRGETAPFDGCECGLYALHPWMVATDAWMSWLPPGRQLAVAGIVEAWGKVQVHPQGIRAQYARPVCLAVVGAPLGSDYGRFVGEVAASHRAELRRFDSLTELTGYCASAHLGLSAETVKTILGVDPLHLED